MRLQGALKLAHRGRQIGVEEALGGGHVSLRLSASQHSLLSTANPLRLPVAPNPYPLQDAQGNFYFLPGYSDPNGTDIQ